MKSSQSRATAKSVDDYISLYPQNVQAILQKLRQTIRDAAPQAKEVISYRIPSYKFHGFLVHFGAFQDHIGFFPTSSPRRVFKKELSKYEGGKGTIRFPLDRPIPYGLVRKIVKFRVRENLGESEESSKAKRYNNKKKEGKK
jgi:uncharacterized protein YdhG (YjbR/CyaY superfamily)